MNTTNQLPNAISTPKENNKKVVLIIIVISLVFIASLWIWKAIEISELKNQAKTNREVLIKQARGQILQAHNIHLKLLAKPFVWALRTELLQGNLKQVNLYLSDMVKEPNIQQIVIANTKGVIIASTNKKDEGQPISSVFKTADALTDEPKIDIAGNVLIMTSPVMGFNNRLGTLLVRYAVPDNNFTETPR